jgi:hypothetical protein
VEISAIFGAARRAHAAALRQIITDAEALIP